MDKASEKIESRPAPDDLLEQARPGDTVVVWRLNRLGRSLKHLLQTVRQLEQCGVAFVSLTKNIDTSTPGGRLGVPRLRRAGRVRARPDPGAHPGRAGRRAGPRPHRWPPPMWTEEKLRTARARRASSDYDVADIARVLGVSRASVYRAWSCPPSRRSPHEPAGPAIAQLSDLNRSCPGRASACYRGEQACLERPCSGSTQDPDRLQRQARAPPGTGALRYEGDDLRTGTGRLRA